MFIMFGLAISRASSKNFSGGKLAALCGRKRQQVEHYVVLCLQFQTALLEILLVAFFCPLRRRLSLFAPVSRGDIPQESSYCYVVIP